jgi:hypothetical protein
LSELLLFQFHLHLLHLLPNAVLGAHGQALPHQFYPKNQEQSGGSEMCEALRNERRDSVAEDGGQHGHSDKRREGGSEDDNARMPHSHERSDEEGLVANFGEYDHGEGKNEGVERLYAAAFAVGVSHAARTRNSLRWGGVKRIVLPDRRRDGKWIIVERVREI